MKRTFFVSPLASMAALGAGYNKKPDQRARIMMKAFFFEELFAP